MRRTVWDGDRELNETQRPPGADTSDVRQDSLGMLHAPFGSSSMDPNPFYGRVAYTYGAAIDQPLSIVRIGYSDITGPNGVVRARRVLSPFAIFPLWNSRGQAQAGAFADGGVNKCEMVSGYERCVKHVWPQGWFALARPRLADVAWHGTLPEDKRDATGTHYRRNRYDPGSGRFTQEDPIGLAGGLNLWGFANGDPVNFSDPYGLKPNDVYVLCRPVGGEGGEGVAGHCAIRVVDQRRHLDVTIELLNVEGKNTMAASRPGSRLSSAYLQPIAANRVAVPEGMTSEQFGDAVLGAAAAEAYKVRGDSYLPFGDVNSNRYIYNVIKAAGGQAPRSASGVSVWFPGSVEGRCCRAALAVPSDSLSH